MLIVVRKSVFDSEGERAAWLLLCAYLHHLRDDESGVWQCLFHACNAIGVDAA